MPTLLKIRRNGVALILHPTLRNPAGRWHSPWERHADLPNAHEIYDVEHPLFVHRNRHFLVEDAIRFGYLSRAHWEAYLRALGGEVQIPRRRSSQRVGRPQAQALVGSILTGSLTDNQGDLTWLTPISDRKFGVEMECYTNLPLVIQKLAEKGIRLHDQTARYSTSIHETQTFWKAVPDGSIHFGGHQPADFQPAEIVSPILSGEAGLRQLFTVCAVLNEVGTKVNRSTGLHIHHDAADMNVEATRRLARNYQNAQDAIDKLVAPSRRADGDHSQYCSGFTREEMTRVSNATSIGDFPGQRYKNVNIAPAYRAHGTFEFRQHHGTVEYKKVAAWILFTQAMMETAKAGRAIESDTKNINVVLGRLQTPGHINAFFKTRLSQLRTGTPEELNGSPETVVEEMVAVNAAVAESEIFTRNELGQVVPRRRMF